MIGKRLAGWAPLQGRWLVYGLVLFLAAVLPCLFLKLSLDQEEPWGGFDSYPGQRAYVAREANKIFLDFAPAVAVVGFVSAVFGLLGSYWSSPFLSRWGGWSIAGLGGMVLLSMITTPVLALALLPLPTVYLWVVAVVRVLWLRRYLLDLLFIPFSLLLLPIAMEFFRVTWSLYVD